MYKIRVSFKDDSEMGISLPNNSVCFSIYNLQCCHDDVIKWKHFPRYLPFVRGIHRSPLNSPHKGQWRGALAFFFICAWTSSLLYNEDTGDLRRHIAHYDVIVMDSGIIRRTLPLDICVTARLDTRQNNTQRYIYPPRGEKLATAR